MKARYWSLDCPDTSDYASSFVNGCGRQAFGLPGIRCSVCNQTWGGARVLTCVCPPEWRSHPLLSNRRPIDDVKHRALCAQVETALASAGVLAPPLMPGDSFQPLEVEFPSRPRCDFLWPTCGTAVVAPRVKALFEQHAITGVAFCPAEIIRVGKLEPTDPFPMPESGEPEDILHEVEWEPEPSRFGPFYQMVPTSESGPPPGAEITQRCPGCGREEYDSAKRELALTPEMLPGTDVFYLATTLWIIVNQRTRDLVLDHGLSNVGFKEMEYRCPV